MLETACSGGDQRTEREKVQDMARKDSIENLKKLLLKRRAALRQALAGDLTMLSGLKEQTAGDVVDAALDSAQNELNSQLAEAESRELAQIENALEQVEAGRYGICERCDNPIPIMRLKALPYATYCIGCQREMELEGEFGQYHGGSWDRVLDTDGDADMSINELEIDA
jgi:DnaK suppressor protein